MPELILMPSLSPTMEKGNLIAWCKNEGDKISIGDIIAEIDTDKATMEVESMQKGILCKILIQAGTHDVAVKTPIAILRIKKDTDEDIENFIKNISQESCTSQTLPPIISHEEKEHFPEPIIEDINKIKASPLAKRLALEYGIDISSILNPSGPGGRIVKQDIIEAKNQKSDNKTSLKRNQNEYTDEIPKPIRKAIADKLSSSKQNIPHFYLNISCNLDKVLIIREVLNSNKRGIKITINDIIVKAIANSLAAHPDVNVSWIDGKLRRYSNIDVCVAVSTPDGIFTPIIKNADQKSLYEISKEIKEKAKLAQEGKLTPKDYIGGSMTVSNLGMFGITRFQAIINPPQGSIISVGASNICPIVNDSKTIEISNIIEFCLSVDHRAIDGAPAARYLQTLKSTLENFTDII